VEVKDDDGGNPSDRVVTLLKFVFWQVVVWVWLGEQSKNLNCHFLRTFGNVVLAIDLIGHLKNSEMSDLTSPQNCE
jgi:hypothetical protein